MASFRSDRLIALRTAKGLSQEQLAARTRSTQPSIQRLEAGGTERPRNLIEIAKVLETSPEYLLGETDNPSTTSARGSPVPPPPSPVISDMVYVHSIDLSFGLGSAIMDTEIVEGQADMMAFPQSWIQMITTSPASMLYWARGQGNSMEPAIRDGDVILIDRSQRDLRFGDLYWAIAYGDTGMIKRLRQMPDGSVKILSDNPSVAPEIAYDGELSVFGRVIAVVHRL